MARILVVEDEKDLQEVLAYNLRQAGHTAILVTNGRDALAAVAEQRPDLVLLDLMLARRVGHRDLPQAEGRAGDARTFPS